MRASSGTLAVRPQTKNNYLKSFYEQFVDQEFSSMKEEIMLRVAEKVRAGKVLSNEAFEKYSSIEKILEKAPEESIIHDLLIRISAQGSHAFRVAIQCPELREMRNGREIDLDAIILYEDLNPKDIEHSPFTLVKETFLAMEPHLKQYDLEAKLKDRCITIYYKNISVDLLPAVYENPSDPKNSKLLIPEKVSGHDYKLVSSAPFELLNRFNYKAELEFLHDGIIKLSNRDGSISVDKYPEHLEYLGVMRYIIVLVKRARDNFFPDVDFGRKVVKSILITAFYSESYIGQKGLLITLDELTQSFNTWAQSVNSDSVRFSNPVDHNEDFAKYLREDPDKLKLLKSFALHLRTKVMELVENSTLQSYKQSLIELFGEDMVKMSVKAIQDAEAELQKSEKHRLNSVGHLSAAGAIAVPKTYFDGDHDED